MPFESHSKIDPSGRYIFSSRPRAVESRSRDGDPPTNISYGNIMYDRRVVRGNTYAQHILPTMPQPDPAEIQKQQENRRRSIARRQARERFAPMTPEAVQGRKHIEVQTDQYLVELSDVIESKDIESQTDAFMDRPTTPLFIPAKSGKDVATQIEEGELFDFDTEVQPMVESLVGQTIQQGLEEVMEEEELASIKAKQRAFRERRNNELAELHRLQEQERRHSEEKARRIAQQREALARERVLAEKIACRAFAEECLTNLLPTVFTSLRNNGFFYDPVERDIETNFIPWLMAEVNNTLEKRNAARQLLDGVIHDIAQIRLEAFKEPETQPDKGGTRT